MEKDLTSIIIVNWNGKDDLQTCFKSLNYIEGIKRVELIIVDNASEDDSIKWLKSFKSKHEKKYHAIKIIQNKENTGFAKGNNIGYEKSKGEYVLLLNNDTIVEPNFLEKLLSSIDDNESIGAVQPRIMQMDNKKLVDSIGSYFINTGFLYHIGHNKQFKKMYDKPDNVFSLKGACMLFKRKVIEKVGLFDENYFAYFEETDLCLRTQIAGYSLKYEPSSIIYHKGGNTSQNIQPGFILFHAYKNRVFTYAKNFDSNTLVMYLPLHIALIIFVAFVYLFTGKFEQSKSIFRSIAWNAKNISFIIKERKKIESFRTVSDSEFLPLVTRQVRPSYYYHLLTTSLRGYKD